MGRGRRQKGPQLGGPASQRSELTTWMLRSHPEEADTGSTSILARIFSQCNKRECDPGRKRICHPNSPEGLSELVIRDTKTRVSDCLAVLGRGWEKTAFGCRDG